MPRFLSAGPVGPAFFLLVVWAPLVVGFALHAGAGSPKAAAAAPVAIPIAPPSGAIITVSIGEMAAAIFSAVGTAALEPPPGEPTTAPTVAGVRGVAAAPPLVPTLSVAMPAVSLPVVVATVVPV